MRRVELSAKPITEEENCGREGTKSEESVSREGDVVSCVGQYDGW